MSESSAPALPGSAPAPSLSAAAAVAASTAATTAAKAAAADSRAPRPGIPLRLLIIEDSPFDASMIRRLLTNAGFAVDALRVEDAQALARALANGPWDAIISDHHLPDFSAPDALRMVESSGLDAPFIIVSGEIGEDVAVEAMRAGADDYVLKSNLSRLPPALQRGLRSAAERRTRRDSERALSASEARLRSITGNLPGMVFQIERTPARGLWNFRHVAGRTYKLFGVNAENLMADARLFLGRIAMADRIRLEETLARGEETLSSVRWDGMIEPMPGSGASPVWLALAGAPRLMVPGTYLWEGVLIDISGQKQAEAALTQSREELRALTLHLESVREEERRSIAREIHDDIGGLLTALKFELAACKGVFSPQALGSGPSLVGLSTLPGRLDAMGGLLESARVAADRIMHNLRPSILDQGIVAALEWLSRQFSRNYGIPCRFNVNQDHVALSEERCAAMFRICQEALTNVARHARASRVQVELFCDTDAATLEISDDGQGMPPDQLERTERFGVRGMRERATGLGGWVEVHGAPGKGTTVMLSLPMCDHHDPADGGAGSDGATGTIESNGEKA